MERSKKIDYLVRFYQAMLKKTEKPEHTEKFTRTINTLQWYEEDDTNTTKVVTLYQKILAAEQQTKDRKKEEESKGLEANQQKIQQIQNLPDPEHDNADEYLREALAAINIDIEITNEVVTN